MDYLVYIQFFWVICAEQIVLFACINLHMLLQHGLKYVLSILHLYAQTFRIFSPISAAHFSIALYMYTYTACALYSSAVACLSAIFILFIIFGGGGSGHDFDDDGGIVYAIVSLHLLLTRLSRSCHSSIFNEN